MPKCLSDQHPKNSFLLPNDVDLKKTLTEDQYTKYPIDPFLPSFVRCYDTPYLFFFFFCFFFCLLFDIFILSHHSSLSTLLSISSTSLSCEPTALSSLIDDPLVKEQITLRLFSSHLLFLELFVDHPLAIISFRHLPMQ